jgi:phosphate transport system substrate-binding protein
VLRQKSFIAAALTAALAGTAYAQAARDYISIVGSSTVYPFATAVAERFGKGTKFKTPKIESTGSGGGFKLFCAGVGVQHPDITNASRRIKASEVENCEKNGVKEITEVEIGYDGIVLANSNKAKHYNLTRKDLYLALAKNVPDPSGAEKLVSNPYTRWNEIDANLPNAKIEVYGPPPTSGTRDAFVELAMDVGCKQFPFIAAMEKSDSSAFKAACQTVREDGAYIEAGENDNLIVQKLVANPNTLGIFGYSFLEENTDKIQGSHVDGKQPTYENISSAAYPLSRALYFYVKKAHAGVIPGIKEYIGEFTSDKAIGPDGYLTAKGLIALPDAMRKQERANALALKDLSLTEKE